MRNFEVTLTYKSISIQDLVSKNILINKQKKLEVELDDSNCISPEEFCNAVINISERPHVVRINVTEKFVTPEKQLFWISENFGRIYFHNGIPLILNKN